ncbi:sensor histidine kinase [Pseudarthrobacter siccitolerans]|uniref:sensor histidine kinase n=1 Tax=Pseudarthrobacter siccitolerans TaxID=861266 RepID=UPI0027B90CD1|nr:sensor histidine kinase [Pseudarthrobacter siccitolerans]
MLRRWGLVGALALIGAAALLYVVIIRGFVESGGHGLSWPLLGVLPMFVFGMWLLTVSSSRSAIFVAAAVTGMAVGSAYEAFASQNNGLTGEPWFPVVNLIGLMGDAVAGAGLVSMFATFPTGVPERRWQRISVGLLWVPVAVTPLSLLTNPHILVPQFLEISDAIPNPIAVPWLGWAAPAVYWVAFQWPSVFFGVGVLLSRAVFGDEGVRARTRIMTWVVIATVLSYGMFLYWPSNPFITAAVFISLITIPIAAIHGILRYGAFDIAAVDRGRLAARSSSLLIVVLYGIAAATPAVLLADTLSPVGAVLLTIVLAVCLLPVRGWLQQWIQRSVFGDRDRQLMLLSELGSRLEQSVEPGDLLTRLAAAVRDGLDATWVRIFLAGPGSGFEPEPTGLAGSGQGAAAASCELKRADEKLGRIDVGPRRGGNYSEAERVLLNTVASQAAAFVANVRLSAQLARQLDDLTASRERLLAAQDGERKRLERDLHDGIQQNVVAQIAGLRLARNRLMRGELTAGELVSLQDQARETLTDLRELAHGIHPPVLSDNGLVAAIESSVARFPIPLAVDADAGLRAERFAEEVETTAYYVVREALANTAKHANAARASVGLVRKDGHLTIAIKDDGCGIDVLLPATHGGLANIRDRVAALRGTVDVTGNQPSGTTVLVDLPLEREGLRHG